MMLHKYAPCSFGLGEEVIQSFPYIIQCKIVTPRAGQF